MSALLQFLGALQARQFLSAAGYTILSYDYFLTFDLEVDYIWHAPWSAVKVIFLLNRYGALIGQSFISLEELGILNQRSQKFCANIQWFQSLLVLFSSEATRTLLLIRARALWGCSHRVTVFFLSAYVLYVLLLSGFTFYIMFKHDTYFVFPFLEETGVCVAYAAAHAVGVWSLGLISFSLDTALFAVIAYHLYRLCRNSPQFHYSPLLRLLVRDALLFYLVNLFHDVLTILSLTVFLFNPLYLMQTVFSFPLLTAAGQRVVLNLRGFHARPNTIRNISHFVDRRIAAMQHDSFQKSADLWMNDLHEELESNQALSRYRSTGSHTSEDASHELGLIHPVGSSRLADIDVVGRNTIAV